MHPTPRPRPRPLPARPSPSPIPHDDAAPAAIEPPLPIIVPSLLASVRGRVEILSAYATGAAHGATRGLAAAAIGTGMVLFAVASIATPLVSDQVTAAKKPALTVAAAAPTIASSATATPSPSPVADERTKVNQKAPADPTTVSELAGNGIPEVALNAYRVAAARVDHADPGCRLNWSLLAGIGRAESDHGRYGGATLHSDGTSTPPIVGPALTGKKWQYFPADSRYVSVTGDTKYAHALGPMQFIPSTWAGYGADADGDGKADIFDVNDAALAAARYLCTAGGDLGTHAGEVRAVMAYNHNDQYLAQVLALADAYKRGVPISGIPVGNTTGSLPKIGHTGKLPPANPGAPTAVDGSTHDHNAKPTHSATPTPTPSSGSGSAGSPTNASATSGSGSSDTTTSEAPSDSSTPTAAEPSPSESSSSTGDSGCVLGLLC